MLFTLIGSVILKHWFKIGVAKRALRVRRVGYRQYQVHTKICVFFLDILHFCSISCEQEPSFSTCWRKPCMFINRSTQGGQSTAEDLLPWLIRFLWRFFSKVIHCSKKTVTSVSLQKLQFRSCTNLMDSVY